MAQTVVFDTNVVISGLLWRGAPYRAVLLAKAHIVRAVCCNPMLAELTQKLREAFDFDENHIESVAYQIRQYADWVEIPEILHVVADDPDDDKFIECAVVGGANWIVSGDRHLLALTEYQGIRIWNARDFLTEIAGQERQESEQGDANGQDNLS